MSEERRCWSCRHWQHGTQNREMRRSDLKSGFSSECEMVRTRGYVHVSVGGDRLSFGAECTDGLEMQPDFGCVLWVECEWIP